MSPILKHLSHEECWVVYLNRANKVLIKEQLSIGGVCATVVDVKIILKRAIELLASSLILIHNHPSGNAKPGENDKVQTKLLKGAADLFDITLLDHVIIAGDSYFSFADDGIM
jgi:DNA repair protein RadC